MKRNLTLYSGAHNEMYHKCKVFAGAPFLVRCFVIDINVIQPTDPWAVIF